MKRSRFLFVGLAALVAAAAAHEAQACNQRPVPPPVFVKPTSPGNATIIIPGYTSFAAAAPPSCTCGLNMPSSVGSVTSAGMFLAGTMTKFFTNDFQPSASIGAAYAAAAGSGVWAGFEAPVGVPVAGGVDLDIQFNVQLAPGKTAKDLEVDLDAGGLLIGTDEGDGLGGLSGSHQHIHPAGEVGMVAPNAPMMSVGGVVAFAGLLVGASIRKIRRQRRDSELTD